MALTDIAIRRAKPRERSYRLADGGCLSLLVNPNGSKWWRFRYRANGHEKMLSFGVYPDVPLKLARERRDEARRPIANHSDPGTERKNAKAEQGDTFEEVSREWFALQSNPPPGIDRAALAPSALTRAGRSWS